MWALDGKRKALEEVIGIMASVSAWAHLRGAGRLDADSADTLAQYALKKAWRGEVVKLAQRAAVLAIEQFKEYSRDQQ